MKMLPKRAKDLTGMKFGRLLVIKCAGKGTKDGKLYWVCECDCGTEISTIGANLKTGNTKSCGCYYKDTRKEGCNYKHGMEFSSEYSSWLHMKDRCYNTNNDSYYNYGGRGIKVCNRWLKSFENFYEDMGDKPTKDYSIDRVDGSKMYAPWNCRWANHEEQSSNRCNVSMYSFEGGRYNLNQISKILKVDYNKLYYKIVVKKEYGYMGIFKEDNIDVEDAN